MIPTVIETRPSEEKQDDMANLPPRAISKARARQAGSAGLSELSKQLRIFQAKNEAQAVEISRLERQLRILADLQGINVADLRKALEEACQNEAFGEMQSRVQKLRAELEAAMLAKGGIIRKDMAAPEIANLELRVGELEEVEEKQQREIAHLYEQLRHERARATRLESECDQWKKDTNEYSDRLKSEAAKASQLEKEFQDQLRKLQEEYAKKMQEGLMAVQSVAKEGGSVSATYISPEMADEYERLLKAMKEKDEELHKAREELKAEHEKNLQFMRERDNAARMDQVNSQVENENRVLLIKQLQDADSQNELRLAQYKTRFAVQDERINDMAQQLESLYTAFGLLKEEQDSDNLTRAALRNRLDEADAAMARQVENQQKKNLKKQMAKISARRSTNSAEGVSTPERQPSSPVASSPTAVTEPFDDPIPPTARPVGGSPGMKERPSHSTWQLLGFPKDQSRLETYVSEQPDHNGVLISGMLIVKSNSMVKNMGRKWKAKNSKIYLNGDHFQWDLGEGKSFALQFGISTIEYNPNHPLSFVVQTDPSNPGSPVIQAAASSEEDYKHWMTALTKATSGGEYNPMNDPALESADSRDLATASSTSPIDNTNQEASDYELAMEISRQEFV
jgi:predicted secreted protein/ABC-type transporter Mla MlaB component